MRIISLIISGSLCLKIDLFLLNLIIYIYKPIKKLKNIIAIKFN